MRRNSRRECFFVNQLRNSGHKVSLAKAGDFVIDEQYIFEVGGAKKKFDQIAGLSNGYIAADDCINFFFTSSTTSFGTRGHIIKQAINLNQI